MRVAATALTGAILAAAVCFAITPARHWTQEQATCFGATYVGRGDKAVTSFAQDPDTYALICQDDKGKVEAVSKRNATLGGLGLSLGLGLLAGALAGGLLALRRRTR